MLYLEAKPDMPEMKSDEILKYLEFTAVSVQLVKPITESRNNSQRRKNIISKYNLDSVIMVFTQSLTEM